MMPGAGVDTRDPGRKLSFASCTSPFGFNIRSVPQSGRCFALHGTGGEASHQCRDESAIVGGEGV